MHINDSLNLVLPIVEDEKGVRVYAYHTPISREVFEANFVILSATLASLSSKGVHYMMGVGPQIAALTLKDEARKEAESRGLFDEEGKPSDITAVALMNEFKRLTQVIVPTENGWETLPVDTALSRGFLDSEDWSEAESALTFFTCNFALARKGERRKIATATASVLMGSVTSSPLMEAVNSLPTLTPDVPTMEQGASLVVS